ncbi:MAG: M48 family metallopeptidase [Spirulina sp.]
MSYSSPITNRNPEPNNRQLLTLLGLFIGFLVFIFWLIGWFINGVVNWIPASVEQQLGSLIIPVYEKQAQPSEIQDTLNQLLEGLEANLADRAETARDYRVLYIPENTINAIAIPGDSIIIYRGLLTEVRSENELMMILGHELGHFAHRDHLRGLGNALLMRILLTYFFGDLGSLKSGVDLVNAIAKAQFSQKQETQADRFGLELLYQYYGHVAGATDFFESLSQQPQVNIPFLSTHPSSRKRVKQLQKLIKQKKYPIRQKQSLPDSLNL